MGGLKSSITTSTATALSGINPSGDKAKFNKDIEIKTSEAIYPIN